MRVLACPRLDLDPAGTVARLCARLAGENGDVVSLSALGLRNPFRGYSAAEVDTLMKVLRGSTGVIGLVCRGADPSAPTEGFGVEVPARVVSVTDHVNLTWRSPLVGPNDDSAGPRFPSMGGIYASLEVPQPDGAEDGMIVVRGVVAGVADDRRLSAYESEVLSRFRWAAVSSELVAPVIVAAHMGLRVAAMVMVR